MMKSASEPARVLGTLLVVRTAEIRLTARNFDPCAAISIASCLSKVNHKAAKK